MIQHAFAVACGLDSMILGEPEILGQMKKAFIAAREGNFAGTTLSQLFERSFNVAKKIRTTTAISRETVSAPAICAKLAERIYGELDQCSALCVGAGTIIESTLSHFAANGVGNLTIANRTLSHARDLAANFGAQTLAYEDVTQQLHQYDIIITATSSVLPVIGKGALERAIRQRKRRPIAIFDLAVPRDVEPEASEIEDIFLHTIDDIGNIAGANLAKRREAAEQAHDHIEAATEDMVEWFARRDAIDVIKDLRSRLDTLRDAELERSIAALQKGANAEQVISKLARRLTSRLAHEPLQSLRDNHANRDLVEELSNWYRDDRANNDKDKPEA
jgi:glutamyl-tRNA reductase